MAAGLGRSAQITPNSGEYKTNEFFGELVIPIFSEKNAVPVLQELTIIGKGRRVDNSVNGKFTAYTGGLQWSPLKDLQLRGNVTRSLRAPSLTELFTPVAPIFTTVADPCAQLERHGRHASRRCARRTARSSSRSTACRRTGWTSNAVTATRAGFAAG